MTDVADEVLRLLLASVDAVLCELKPGQSLSPAGAGRTNALIDARNVAREVLSNRRTDTAVVGEEALLIDALERHALAAPKGAGPNEFKYPFNVRADMTRAAKLLRARSPTGGREAGLEEAAKIAEIEARRCQARVSHRERDGDTTGRDLWQVSADTAQAIAESIRAIAGAPAIAENATVAPYIIVDESGVALVPDDQAAAVKAAFDAMEAPAPYGKPLRKALKFYLVAPSSALLPSEQKARS